MTPTRRRSVLVLLAALFASTVAAGVDIRSHRDKQFDFLKVVTWAWHPDGAGKVVMSLGPEEDPAAMTARLEPIITRTVEEELALKHLAKGLVEKSDVHVTYYVLLSAGSSTQTLGQFLPSTAECGLPPLSGATTSLKVVERGALVIDVTSPSAGKIVWRGIAEAKLDRSRDQIEQNTRLREAVRDVMRRFPK